MPRSFLAGCAIVLLALACSTPTGVPVVKSSPTAAPSVAVQPPQTLAASGAPLAGATPTGQAGARAEDCPVTPRRGWYYESPDGKIWTNAVEFGRLGGQKVGWSKPEGSELKVSGRRLDGAAPPLGVQFSGGGAGVDYQPSGLHFPTEGC